MLDFPRDHDTGGIGGILDISRQEKDPQQHSNTLEQISHVTPLPCSPPEVHTYGNEWQSISWDALISMLTLPANRGDKLFIEKHYCQGLKKRDMSSWISQIKHIDNGSNDNVFWQIFEELQNQSPDKKTVNGHKLKTRLVSTNKFFVGVKL